MASSPDVNDASVLRTWCLAGLRREPSLAPSQFELVAPRSPVLCLHPLDFPHQDWSVVALRLDNIEGGGVASLSDVSAGEAVGLPRRAGQGALVDGERGVEADELATLNWAR